MGEAMKIALRRASGRRHSVTRLIAACSARRRNVIAVTAPYRGRRKLADSRADRLRDARSRAGASSPTVAPCDASPPA
jgi:hypothetical protein